MTPPTESETEDRIASAPRANSSQRTRKRRAQSHSGLDNNTSNRQNSAMDIDSITEDPDTNDLINTPYLQATSSQRPRRSATKANYNYDNQFQYLEDEQDSDAN
ncbi:hypothetical protein QWA68_016843 [Fusarium oxysporum]|nr:hypothetical protein QWA68_016843 [Fusarium oxysporum]